MTGALTIAVILPVSSGTGTGASRAARPRRRCSSVLAGRWPGRTFFLKAGLRQWRSPRRTVPVRSRICHTAIRAIWPRGTKAWADSPAASSEAWHERVRLGRRRSCRPARGAGQGADRAGADARSWPRRGRDIDLKSSFDAVARFSQPVPPSSKHTEAASLACRTALLERDVAHLILPDAVRTRPGDAPADGQDMWPRRRISTL